MHSRSHNDNHMASTEPARQTIASWKVLHHDASTPGITRDLSAAYARAMRSRKLRPAWSGSVEQAAAIKHREPPARPNWKVHVLAENLLYEAKAIRARREKKERAAAHTTQTNKTAASGRHAGMTAAVARPPAAKAAAGVHAAAAGAEPFVMTPQCTAPPPRMRLVRKPPLVQHRAAPARLEITAPPAPPPPAPPPTPPQYSLSEPPTARYEPWQHVEHPEKWRGGGLINWSSGVPAGDMPPLNVHVPPVPPPKVQLAHRVPPHLAASSQRAHRPPPRQPPPRQPPAAKEVVAPTAGDAPSTQQRPQQQPSYPPMFAPEPNEPTPMPSYRWAPPARPGDSVHRGQRTPRVPHERAPLMSSELQAGLAAKACIAPNEVWGGPYRARRPDGAIAPSEMVLGLDVRPSAHTSHFRRALRQQYLATEKPPEGRKKLAWQDH